MLRKSTLLIVFSLLLANGSMAASKVMESCTLKSSILKMERKFSVYLPDGYDENMRSYPVLYLLHGATDDHTAWIQFGEMQGITDKAIREGQATPMIIVMPDADTGRRGYFNDIQGDFNYENFFIQELIPFVEKEYRCRKDRQYRAVAGLSMGGGGTLVYALHYPELFATACPLSAAVFPELNKQKIKDQHAEKNVFLSNEAIEQWCDKYDILKLVNSFPDDQKNKIRWYIDCGDKDFLYEGNALLHIAMRKQNIPHEFRIREGDHGWKYWRESLPEVLKFISTTFTR